MGLHDLLAVVLGVKTAEALDERRWAKENAGWAVREAEAELRAELAAERAEAERLTPDWNAQVQPLLDRAGAIDPTLSTAMFKDKAGFMFGMLYILPLCAADLAKDDFLQYRRALQGSIDGPSYMTEEAFATWTEKASVLRAQGGDLLDEIFDAYLREPAGHRSSDIQGMRRALGLGPLVPLSPNKPCPRCAEMVKRQAQVCRFCGHEFTASP